MELPIARLLLAEIKNKLKDRKITYASFAGSLEMSESGLKKLLGSDDCSLQKIQRMCSILGLSFFDLVESIEDSHLYEVQFSKAQEDYFEKERIGFLLYWLVVYERRTLSEAAALLRLDEKRLQRILLKLDRLQLVQLHANGRLQLPDPVAIRWVSRSAFVLRLYQKWGVSLIMRNTQPQLPTDSYMMIRYLKASEQTYNEMRSELEALDKKYSNKATREMRVKTDSLRDIRLLMLMDNQSWIQTDELGLQEV